eukprot:SAG22_NODE_1534_length_4202_cov_4.250407_1_plen_1139_part_00
MMQQPPAEPQPAMLRTPSKGGGLFVSGQTVHYTPAGPSSTPAARPGAHQQKASPVFDALDSPPAATAAATPPPPPPNLLDAQATPAPLRMTDEHAGAGLAAAAAAARPEWEGRLADKLAATVSTGLSAQTEQLGDLLMPQLAELQAQLGDAMAEVGRLEREKASWMELYSQSETELAVMVARNAEEQAVAVAADAEEYVAKVQASFLTAALRRHAKAVLAQAFGGWSGAAVRQACLRGLVTRNLLRADGRLLWRCISVWVTHAFASQLLHRGAEDDDDEAAEYEEAEYYAEAEEALHAKDDEALHDHEDYDETDEDDDASAAPPPPPKTAAYGFFGLHRPPVPDVMAAVASLPADGLGEVEEEAGDQEDSDMSDRERAAYEAYAVDNSLLSSEYCSEHEEGDSSAAEQEERLEAAMRGDTAALAAAYHEAASRLEVTMEQYEAQLTAASLEFDAIEAANERGLLLPTGTGDFQADEPATGNVVPAVVATRQVAARTLSFPAAGPTSDQGSEEEEPLEEASDEQGQPAWLEEMHAELLGSHSTIRQTGSRASAAAGLTVEVEGPVDVDGEIEAADLQGSPTQWLQVFETPPRPDAPLARLFDNLPAPDPTAAEAEAEAEAEAAAEQQEAGAAQDQAEQDRLGDLFDALLGDAAAAAAAGTEDEAEEFDADGFAEALQAAGGEAAALAAAAAAAERQMSAAARRHCFEGMLWRAMTGWIEVTKWAAISRAAGLGAASEAGTAEPELQEQEDGEAEGTAAAAEAVAEAMAGRLGEATAALDGVMSEVEAKLAELDPKGWAALQPELAALEATAGARASSRAEAWPGDTADGEPEVWGDGASEVSSETYSEHMARGDTDSSSGMGQELDEELELEEEEEEVLEYAAYERQPESPVGDWDDYLLGAKAEAQLRRRQREAQAAGQPQGEEDEQQQWEEPEGPALTPTQARLLAERQQLAAEWREWAREQVALRGRPHHPHPSNRQAISPESSWTASEDAEGDDDTEDDAEELSELLARHGAVAEAMLHAEQEEQEPELDGAEDAWSSEAAADSTAVQYDYYDSNEESDGGAAAPQEYEEYTPAEQQQQRLCWEVLELEYKVTAASPPVSPTSPVMPAMLRPDFLHGKAAAAGTVTPDYDLSEWC